MKRMFFLSVCLMASGCWNPISIDKTDSLEEVISSLQEKGYRLQEEDSDGNGPLLESMVGDSANTFRSVKFAYCIKMSEYTAPEDEVPEPRSPSTSELGLIGFSEHTGYSVQCEFIWFTRDACTTATEFNQSEFITDTDDRILVRNDSLARDLATMGFTKRDEVWVSESDAKRIELEEFSFNRVTLEDPCPVALNIVKVAAAIGDTLYVDEWVPLKAYGVTAAGGIVDVSDSVIWEVEGEVFEVSPDGKQIKGTGMGTGTLTLSGVSQIISQATPGSSSSSGTDSFSMSVTVSPLPVEDPGAEEDFPFSVTDEPFEEVSCTSSFYRSATKELDEDEALSCSEDDFETQVEESWNIDGMQLMLSVESKARFRLGLFTLSREEAAEKTAEELCTEAMNSCENSEIQRDLTWTSGISEIDKLTLVRAAPTCNSVSLVCSLPCESCGEQDEEAFHKKIEGLCGFSADGDEFVSMTVSQELPVNRCTDSKHCSGQLTQDEEATVRANVTEPEDYKFAEWKGDSCPCDKSTDRQCTFRYGAIKGSNGDNLHQSCAASSKLIPTTVISATESKLAMASNRLSWSVTTGHPNNSCGANGCTGTLKENVHLSATITATVIDPTRFTLKEWTGDTCPCNGSTESSCEFDFGAYEGPEGHFPDLHCSVTTLSRSTQRFVGYNPFAFRDAFSLSISNEHPDNQCDSYRCFGDLIEGVAEQGTISATANYPDASPFFWWLGESCPCQFSRDPSCTFRRGFGETAEGELPAQRCTAVEGYWYHAWPASASAHAGYGVQADYYPADIERWLCQNERDSALSQMNYTQEYRTETCSALGGELISGPLQEEGSCTGRPSVNFTQETGCKRVIPQQDGSANYERDLICKNEFGENSYRIPHPDDFLTRASSRHSDTLAEAQSSAEALSGASQAEATALCTVMGAQFHKYWEASYVSKHASWDPIEGMEMTYQVYINYGFNCCAMP